MSANKKCLETVNLLFNLSNTYFIERAILSNFIINAHLMFWRCFKPFWACHRENFFFPAPITIKSWVSPGVYQWPKMEILSSVFFCKHPILDSTKRFFNKDWRLCVIGGHGDQFLYFQVLKFFPGALKNLKSKSTKSCLKLQFEKS